MSSSFFSFQKKKKKKKYNYLESLFERKTFERTLLFLRPSPVRWNLATDQLSRSSCIIIGSIVIWPEVYSHCSRTRGRIQEPALDFRRMMMLWRQGMTLRRLFQSRPRERDWDSACYTLIHICRKYTRRKISRVK